MAPAYSSGGNESSGHLCAGDLRAGHCCFVSRPTLLVEKFRQLSQNASGTGGILLGLVVRRFCRILPEQVLIDCLP